MPRKPLIAGLCPRRAASVGRSAALTLALCCVFGSPLHLGCTQVKKRIPVVAYSDDGQYLEPQYGRGLVAAAESPIPDVPVPIGFVLVRSQSDAQFDGTHRTLTHVYQGRADLEELRFFFDRSLTRSGWQATGPASAPIRTYTKGGELLNLGICSDGQRATVTAVIFPASAV